MSRNSLVFVAAGLLVVGSQSAFASSITYQTDAPFVTAATVPGQWTASNPAGSGDYTLYANSIDNLPKFDSTLGTLNSVEFFVDATYFAGVHVYASGSQTVATNLASFAVMEASPILSLSYTTTPGGDFFSLIDSELSIRAACYGDPGASCDSIGQEVEDVFAGGSGNVLSIVDSLDIVGRGSVQGFELGIALPDDAQFLALANLHDATGEGNIFLNPFADGSMVGVTYNFTPVPLPGAVWLLGSALGLLGAYGRTRRRPLSA